MQGRSHWGRGGGAGGHSPTTSIFETKKVQQLQLQTSKILLFTGAQKLYGAEISRFSLCMLQFLDNIQRLLISSNYIGEIDHIDHQTDHILKRSDT